jgi:dienelactone hydrolase
VDQDVVRLWEAPPARSLEELKDEVLRRAERNAYPLIGLALEDVRAAVASISSLDRDVWGAAWIALGDRYDAEARGQAATDREAAARNFIRAWRLYGFGRWPVPNSALKQAAYEKSLSAFANYAGLTRTFFETVRIPSEFGDIVGYLQLPQDVRSAPLVVAISGLDSRKEDLAERCGWLLPHGIGSLALDAPGTGQAPVRASETADRIYSLALDYLASRGEVDARRIALFGGSFGGYWATKLAIVERERLVGVVAQSPGIHETYQLAHLRKALANTEYLFDLVPAQTTTFDGVVDFDGLAQQRARLSLLTQGLLSRPAAPMLVIAGARDTQTPIEDIELLLRSGTTPKDAWINPVGGHMGRDTSDWNDIAIFKTVTMPWLARALGEPMVR